MKDLYNLLPLMAEGKNSKKPQNRGKSFGYQVLGFGSGGGGLGPLHGLFLMGQSDAGITNVNNRVSPTGVVEDDVAGVGTARTMGAATSYGSGLALTAYGYTTSYVSMSNLIDIKGIVATDTVGVGTARGKLGGCSYGGDKGIFSYGQGVVNNLSMSNLVSNTGVIGTDVTGVGTGRYAPGSVGYGTDKGIVAFGHIGGGPGSSAVSNLISSSGVVATDTSAAAGTNVCRERGGVTYGGDKAIIVYGASGSYGGCQLDSNLISSSGVVAANVTQVGTLRAFFGGQGVPYDTDKGVIAFGEICSGYVKTNISNLVSNTGVVASDTAGVGTSRYNATSAGCGV